MQTTSTSTYTPQAKLFHWLTLFLLAIQYTIGWLMPDVHRDTQPVGLIDLHLSFGALIVLLVVLRLAWRIAHPVPQVNASPLLRRIALATHGLLYVLLVAFPLMGWANASSRGWPVSLFGLIPLPALSPKGSSFGHLLGDLHQLTAWVLIAVVALHVIGALYHHFILKDETLKRMLPT